jgi:hypothetical protein
MRTTTATLRAEIASLRAEIAAMRGSVAASPIAVKPKTYFTRAEINAGDGFPCTLGCGRRLRTAARAAGGHDVATGGHTAAK